MKGATRPIIPSTTPVHAFDSGGITQAIAVFPDGRRLLSRTAFRASVFRLWDLRDGILLKEMKGHNSPVGCFVISRKGRLIASGDDSGHVIAWDGDTGAPLIPAFRCFRTRSGVQSLDFSPGGDVLVVCSSNGVVTFWSTDTWQQQGEPLYCGPDPNGPSGSTYGVRYSPSGELLILSNSNMQLWNPITRSRIHIHDTQSCHHNSSVWTPDGTRLLAGGEDDIREWDLSTWNKVGACNRWEGHTGTVLAIALNPNGTLVASTSKDRHVRLWRLSDARTLAIFQYTIGISCVAFTADGKHVLVGSFDSKISEWAVPSDALLEDTPEATHQGVSSQRPASKGQDSDARSQDPDWAIVSRRQPLDEGRQSTGAKGQDSDARGHGHDWTIFSRRQTLDERKQSTAAKRQDSYTKILVMSAGVHKACITGDLLAAEELLTEEIADDSDSHISYANRSFVMARKLEWDHALHDATESLSIQPSLMGYVSKGIALCGKKQVQDANNAFEIASMFTDGDLRTIQSLFLIKTVALVSADQHADSMRRVRELSAVCPNADTNSCRVVEAHLYVQLGNNAMDRGRQNKAADHFTAAVNACDFLSKADFPLSEYEHFVVLFGWDLRSLWQTANQKRCHALLRAGRLAEVFGAYRHMMDMSDETTKANCHEWSTAFMHELNALYAPKRNAHNDDDDDDDDDDNDRANNSRGVPENTRTSPRTAVVYKSKTWGRY